MKWTACEANEKDWLLQYASHSSTFGPLESRGALFVLFPHIGPKKDIT